MADDFGLGVMEDGRVAEGIKVQAEHCRRNDAPVTARIIEAQLALMQGDTMCGRRIANWPGLHWKMQCRCVLREDFTIFC